VVAATSSTDVWAVGQSSNSTTTATLIEHWDGTGWTVKHSPVAGV